MINNFLTLHALFNFQYTGRESPQQIFAYFCTSIRKDNNWEEEIFKFYQILVIKFLDDSPDNTPSPIPKTETNSAK